MALDAFLQIDGVNGEATREGFQNAIEILSFSMGASNPVIVGSGATGLAAGKASVSEFSIMKQTDSASALLFQACCSGKHFPKAKITLHRAGGDNPVDYLVYELEEVMISSLSWSGSTGEDRPTESLSLSFGKITVTYSPQTGKGDKKASPVIGSWDLRKVTK